MMHVGDAKSTSGDVGGYHEYSGGYHEYIGGCSVHWQDSLRVSRFFSPITYCILRFRQLRGRGVTRI